MKIRRATKKDLEKYILIEKESGDEYSKLIKRRVRFTREQIKKDFKDCLKNKKRFILILKQDGGIIGYLKVSVLENNYEKFGYIDNIFVKKKFRKKGLGTKLIFNVIKELKKKKVKICTLGVDIKNKNALKLYEKLGFKLSHYEMDFIIK